MKEEKFILAIESLNQKKTTKTNKKVHLSANLNCWNVCVCVSVCAETRNSWIILNKLDEIKRHT